MKCTPLWSSRHTACDVYQKALCVHMLCFLLGYFAYSHAVPLIPYGDTVTMVSFIYRTHPHGERNELILCLPGMLLRRVKLCSDRATDSQLIHPVLMLGIHGRSVSSEPTSDICVPKQHQASYLDIKGSKSDVQLLSFQ
ncbi:hypothetical protein J3A83DRAFT_223060 [Scleroderma citrinum]